MRTMVETIAALLLMACALSSCGAGQQGEAVSENPGETPVVVDSIRVAVYVVDSPWGRAYHRSRMCAGLRRATHEVVVIDSLEAEARHFSACKICYRKSRVIVPGTTWKAVEKSSGLKVPAPRKPLTEPGGCEE